MSEQNLLNYNLFKANNNNFQFDYSIPPTITTNHEISAIQQRTVTFFFFFFFSTLRIQPFYLIVS